MLRKGQIMFYNIKISESKNIENKARAYATVVFGNSFAVKNIAIVEKKDGEGVFVSMPSLKTKDLDELGNPVYKEICNPITADFQKEFTGAILQAYELKKEGKLDKDGLVIGDESAELNYRVSVTPYEKSGSNIRGLASVYLEDSFVISSITLINGKNGVFVSMPAYKANIPSKDGENTYRDIAYPITKEFRAEISKAILDEYHYKRNKRLEEKLGVNQDIPEMSEQVKAEEIKTEEKSENKKPENIKAENIKPEESKTENKKKKKPKEETTQKR